jgi:hypothetical protein
MILEFLYGVGTSSDSAFGGGEKRMEVKMNAELKSIKPNPMRNFTTDPLDDEAVSSLQKSIAEHGYWGGVVCRKRKDGVIECAAGWHRIHAAIAEGIKSAEVSILDLDDDQMRRLYATENATQRGNTGTAQAGSVASTIYYVAREVLSGPSSDFRRRYPSISIEDVRGGLLAGRGIGRETILALLDGIPGINVNTVNDQLANLKAAGIYASIIADVQDEIAEKSKSEEVKKQARVAASVAAEKSKRTFDFQGVSKQFKNPHQVKTFREAVTRGAVSEALPVREQANLAKKLVAEAKEEKKSREEISGAFIQGKVVDKLLATTRVARELTEKQKQELIDEDMIAKCRHLQRDFSQNCRGAFTALLSLEKMFKAWPKGLEKPITGEFTKALDTIGEIVAIIKTTIRGGK